MIKISIYKNKDNECIGFDTLGHAGAGMAGQDIVCAAVSILVINTINAIENLTDTAGTVTSDEQEGMISYRLENSPAKEALLLLDSMILGLVTMESDDN